MCGKGIVVDNYPQGYNKYEPTYSTGAIYKANQCHRQLLIDFSSLQSINKSILAVIQPRWFICNLYTIDEYLLYNAIWGAKAVLAIDTSGRD